MKIKKLLSMSLDNYSFGILFIAVFLLPIFFISYPGVSLDYSKNILLQITVLLSFILWLIARLKGGEISFPKSCLLSFVFLIPIIFTISSFYSSSINASIFGFGYELGTSITILTLFLIMFLSSIYFQTSNRVFYVYLGFIVSFLVLTFYHILRFIFGADLLSFGLFTSSSSSIIGKWNDLSIFFGLISILSLSTLYLLNLSKIIKILLYLVLLISLFFVILINFSLTWILIGIFSLLIFVYTISFNEKNTLQEDKNEFKHKINKSAFLSLTVSILAVIFLFPGNPVSNFLTQKLNISYVEARPSWGATAGITKNVLKSNPVLGVGPNRFSEQWSKFKPNNINKTIFWNTKFDFGVGIIPSFAVTTGLLGMLIWIIFIILFIYKGSKYTLTLHENKTSHYLIFSSFILSLYLWAVAIFYVPSIPIFAFAFLLTGIFIASLIESGDIKNIKFSFSKKPKIGFASVLVAIILIIGSVALEYFFVQRLSSSYLFGKGIIQLNKDNNIGLAESYMIRASKLYGNDVYYRTLSNIQTAKINTILKNNNIKKQQARALFYEALGNSINSARKAIAFDETNYLNWISVGNVYESIILFKVDGAYKSAILSYKKALSLDPNNPEIYLVLARTEFAKGNISNAKKYIESAIKLKGNYTRAIFFLSQIEASEGKLDAAISAAERASVISPNDTGIFFQIGFLRYQNKDYREAVIALERAVILQPVYSNAKYFLGLSYSKVGRKKDAINQFKDIVYLNPDNNEVKRILSNLEKGRSPFVNIAPPLPEKRENLPIKEQ